MHNQRKDIPWRVPGRNSLLPKGLSCRSETSTGFRQTLRRQCIIFDRAVLTATGPSLPWGTSTPLAVEIASTAEGKWQRTDALLQIYRALRVTFITDLATRSPGEASLYVRTASN